MTEIREKSDLNRHKLSENRIGVAAILTHNGKQYGLPLQKEDSEKFEMVLSSPDDEVIDYAYLRERNTGIVSGGVEEGETIDEALRREVVSELAELLSFSKKKVENEILPKLKWSELKRVPDFTVAQAIQNKVGGENKPRAKFDIFATMLELPDDIFEQLSEVLKPIDIHNENLRPLVAALLKVK